MLTGKRISCSTHIVPSPPLKVEAAMWYLAPPLTVEAAIWYLAPPLTVEAAIWYNMVHI